MSGEAVLAWTAIGFLSVFYVGSGVLHYLQVRDQMDGLIADDEPRGPDSEYLLYDEAYERLRPRADDVE